MQRPSAKTKLKWSWLGCPVRSDDSIARKKQKTYVMIQEGHSGQVDDQSKEHLKQMSDEKDVDSKFEVHLQNAI